MYIPRKALNEKIGLSASSINKIFKSAAGKDQIKRLKRKKFFSFVEAVEYLTIFSGSEEQSREVINQIFMNTHQN